MYVREKYTVESFRPTFLNFQGMRHQAGTWKAQSALKAHTRPALKLQTGSRRLFAKTVCAGDGVGLPLVAYGSAVLSASIACIFI